MEKVVSRVLKAYSLYTTFLKKYMTEWCMCVGAEENPALPNNSPGCTLRLSLKWRINKRRAEIFFFFPFPPAVSIVSLTRSDSLSF